jgi:hypothetical protein
MLEWGMGYFCCLWLTSDQIIRLKYESGSSQSIYHYTHHFELRFRDLSALPDAVR